MGNALERRDERWSNMEAHQEARIGNWVCSTGVGGMMRCQHINLDTSLTINTDGISGIAEIPSYDDSYTIDIETRKHDFEH